MALWAPDVEWPKKGSVLAVPPLQSQQRIYSKEVFYTTFTFWFHLFRSADKIYEDETVVHLVLPPHPCNVTARTLLYLRHSILTDLPLPPPPSCLPIGWRSGPLRSHVFGRRRERGETGITSLHVGWYRAQRVLVLVTLMPHMETGQG